MNEFLLQNYSWITHGVEIIAALAGIFCFKKYKNTKIKYFIWFLMYVAILELVGSYPRYVIAFEFLKDAKEYLKGTKFQNNYWFFTIFWSIGSALFYTFYFRMNIKSNVFKTILNYGIILFLAGTTIHLAINGNLFFSVRPIFINVSGVSIILLAIIFYLLEILKSDKVLKFHKSINFYIAATVLLWLMITTPLTFYNNYFSSADWNFVFLKWQIFLFANVFMYLTFTFALLWCNPHND
ncbi:MAG: hypothetical protein R2797_08475 [Gelidibacter sp.]